MRKSVPEYFHGSTAQPDRLLWLTNEQPGGLVPSPVISQSRWTVLNIWLRGSCSNSSVRPPNFASIVERESGGGGGGVPAVAGTSPASWPPTPFCALDASAAAFSFSCTSRPLAPGPPLESNPALPLLGRGDIWRCSHLLPPPPFFAIVAGKKLHGSRTSKLCLLGVKCEESYR